MPRDLAIKYYSYTKIGYLEAVNIHVSLVAILLIAVLWAATSPEEVER